jgi:4-hydroxy-tetrahydrodipicolinate reductase
MSKTRVCVAGATGKVGAALVKAVVAAEDMALVGAVARGGAGTRLPGTDVTVTRTVKEALAHAPCDVFVDYTRADAVKGHVLAALAAGAHVVVGSSGLSDGDYADIDAAARASGRGVFAAGNFAITAVLLARFAAMAAAELPSWEIVDYAHAGKIDAPSGTARELASRLAAVRPPELKVPVTDTVGAREARGATLGGAQLHSLRLPGYSSSVEIVFGLPGERLTLRHDSTDPSAPYVGGTMLAIRRVSALTGVVRGLEQLLFG